MILYRIKKNRFYIAPAVLALCAAAAIAGAPAPWTAMTLDPAQSRVEFTLGDVLHTVHGTFKVKSGVIRFDPATGEANGEMVVDAASGDSGSGARDRRMHKNILESKRYPEIVFVPNRVEGQLAAQGTSRLSVHGLFRIHGVEHELTLPFQVQNSNGAIVADTNFVVPYVQWGMKNPSNFLLRVSDKVNIDIHAVGKLTSGSAGPQISRATR